MNTVERMKILTDGTEVRLADVPREVLFPGSESRPATLDPEVSLAELERRHILSVLNYTDGNKTRAAGILGISTRTLYNKLAEYEKE